MLPSPEAWLPAANSALILLSGVALLIGYAFIRNGQVTWHKRSMLTASTLAVLFLVVYVTRVLVLPTKLFPGEGTLRVVYFAILISHIVLATAILPLALITLSRALRQRFDRHVPIARWTLPLWLYVSVTGVIVYLMLYRLY